MQPCQLQLPFPTETARNERGLLLPQSDDGLTAVLTCIEDSSAIPVVPARDSRPHWAAGEEQGGSLWGVTQPVTAAVVGRGPGVRAAMAPYS